MKFQIGDVVEATDYIGRVDWKTTLRPGDRAIVWKIWEDPENGVQVIDVEVPNHHPICDLVCLPHLPLKLVERSE